MTGHCEATVYLDLPVTPNNSLSRRGMVGVLCLLGAFNIFTAIFMIVIGAYPAPIFLGADMVAVSVAFYQIDRRRLRQAERVRISTDRVEVYRTSGGKPIPVWNTAPGFTRVVLVGTDLDLPVLTLASAGRSLPIGADLGGDGRRKLAADIEAAIIAARNERYSC